MATNTGATTSTYSRADASLWDDGELIRLWNEQLAVLNSKSALKPGADSEDSESESMPATSAESEASDPSDVSGDSARSSTEDGDAVAGRGCGRAFAALTRVTNTHVGGSPSAVPQTNKNGSATGEAGCPISVSHLPADVQALVQAFYAAGFEAGRYVAQSQPRKRARD